MENKNDEFDKKQKLVNKEIIEKNYDKESFMNFLENKKENGQDLNNWTLGELTIAVCQYLAKIEKPNGTKTEKPTEIHSEIINEQKSENKINQENEENENIIKNIENLENFHLEENFKEIIINCRKLEKTQMNDSKIIVTISNPTEYDAGVFAKNYIVYKVQTVPFEWVVLRRYSDFDLLRKLLVKHFPSFYLPPLPNKKLGKRNFEIDFINKRMRLLNLFINDLVQNETFKASDILNAFLSYEDRDKLESKFKEYSTMQPSTYVEEYRTLDGKAIILPDDEKNEKYFNNINKYFTIQGEILDKLNLSLKTFFNNMMAVTESLQNVQKNFEILHLLNTKALMKENITKLYKEMSRFFNNYKKILIKQNKMVKIHMKDFFKYINLEGKAYKELIERREELKVKYTAENQRVTTKKEKLYNTLDINKFELGEDEKRVDKNRLLNDKKYAMEHICRNDTSSLVKIYNQLGYANKMNILELKKLIQEYSSRYVVNFKKFDEEFYPSINDLVTSWSNLETFVMSANLSK